MVPLKKLYYQNRAEWDVERRRRYESGRKLNFTIGGQPAFFSETAELSSLLSQIRRTNRDIKRVYDALPGAAAEQFKKRCLIDEVVLTNSIEGVYSTRREIGEILEDLGARGPKRPFYGLVQKYNLLMNREEIPLNTPEDIRNLYDELVLAEVRQEDPDSVPDGKLFRKGPVSIYSPAQKEIHRGLLPEEAIYSGLAAALAFLREDSCDILYRTAVFHYLFEYIHPFYDGNGRLGRFLCSYLLSRALFPLTAYRFSSAVRGHLDDYYKAFSVCNDFRNGGDVTPFVEMFCRMVFLSLDYLCEAFYEGFTRLATYSRTVKSLAGENKPLREIYTLLIQAALFSEYGISREKLLFFGRLYAQITPEELDPLLAKIPENLLIVRTREGRQYYSLNLEQLENP